MYLHNNHASSTGTTVLKLVQDANAPALYIDNQGNQASIAVSSDDNVFISIDTTQSNGDEWQIINAVGGTTSNLQFKNIDQSKVVMLMEENGRIGISNTEPDYKLDVSGDMRVEQTADATIATFIGSDGNNATIEIHADDGDDNADKWRMTANTAGALAIGSYSTGSWVNHLKLDANSRISLSNNDGGGIENTVFGKNAMNSAATDMTANVIIGHSAGLSINHADADDNVIIGNSAGTGGSAGLNNCTIIGRGAVQATAANGLTGVTAIGSRALTALTSGVGNVAVGYQSGDALTDSGYNTVVGHQSLSTEIQGSHTTAIGYQAGFAQNKGSSAAMHNTLIGLEAGYHNVTGTNNTYVGSKAGTGVSTNSNSNNVGVGTDALLSITTGSGNVALGYRTLEDVTDGASNIAIGNASGIALTSGDDNIAIGTNCLYNSTAVSDAIFIGKNAGNGVLTADADGAIGIGFESLSALTTGARNLAIGYQALNDMTEGHDNIAIGYQALDGMTTDANANQNIGIGNYVMDVGSNSASTAQNVCIGHNSGTLLTGDDNTCVGNASGDTISSGEKNTIIGSGADTSAGTTQNATAIGYGTVTKGNNTVTLGDSNVDHVYMAFDSGAKVWCTNIDSSSDARIKKNVEKTTLGLNFVNELNPVTFNMRKSEEWDNDLKKEQAWFKNIDSSRDIDDKDKKIGFIAQEVKACLDKYNVDCDIHSVQEDSKIEGIDYSRLVVPLVKAVQELSAKVTELEAKLK
jgi:hypothetical protein